VAAGTVQAVLVCVPASSGDSISTVDQQVCPPVNGQNFHLQSQSAYVLSPDSAGYIDSIAQPFDYTQAAGFWGFAFTTVLVLWLVARSAGSVISVVRRGF
jgi:hypothetical protein